MKERKEIIDEIGTVRLHLQNSITMLSNIETELEEKWKAEDLDYIEQKEK